MDVSLSEVLFYGGVVVMGVAVLAGIAAAIFLHVAQKRLNRRLEKEFGKRHR